MIDQPTDRLAINSLMAVGKVEVKSNILTPLSRQEDILRLHLIAKSVSHLLVQSLPDALLDRANSRIQ